jgi:hypothetical protein
VIGRGLVRFERVEKQFSTVASRLRSTLLETNGVSRG